MFNFLKNFLKTQASFFSRTYLPAISILIFLIFAVNVFPSFAIETTVIFAVIVFVFIFITAKPSR
ncbi:hypothetical protein GM30_04190 [Trabulsiella odontotermitis]|nr:hypothetical protein GM30_04190 [Trabulsiella odontotermitis]